MVFQFITMNKCGKCSSWISLKHENSYICDLKMNEKTYGKKIDLNF
jgi:hypothetical protein